MIIPTLFSSSVPPQRRLAVRFGANLGTEDIIRLLGSSRSGDVDKGLESLAALMVPDARKAEILAPYLVEAGPDRQYGWHRHQLLSKVLPHFKDEQVLIAILHTLLYESGDHFSCKAAVEGILKKNGPYVYPALSDDSKRTLLAKWKELPDSEARDLAFRFVDPQGWETHLRRQAADRQATTTAGAAFWLGLPSQSSRP